MAVFGQSMDGETALHVVDRDLAAQFFKERFRAAIAYYPYCDIPAATMTAPTLIPICEADERSPVEQCREMVAHARPDGLPIALTVYPGVHHNFDVALMTPVVRYRGFWLEYNESAAKDAEKKDARIPRPPSRRDISWRADGKVRKGPMWATLS